MPAKVVALERTDALVAGIDADRVVVRPTETDQPFQIVVVLAEPFAIETQPVGFGLHPVAAGCRSGTARIGVVDARHQRIAEQLVEPEGRAVVVEDEALGKTHGIVVALPAEMLGPEVHAEDDVGINSVEFYVDGTLKLLDFYSPYSFRLNNVVGKHSIKAVVTDGQFNIINISQGNIVVFSYGINREPSIDLYAHTGDAKDPAGDDIPSIKMTQIKLQSMLLMMRAILSQFLYSSG